LEGAETIGRTQLHDHLVKGLRKMVMRAVLPPGTRIPERMLCERFGVSRTPLREALKVLAASGLVELLPNRGAWVTPLRSSDVRDCFQVLIMLETGAAELAASRMTAAIIAQLRRQHETMLLHLGLGEREHVFRLDLELHRTLVDAAGNRQLATTHADLTVQVERARYLAILSDQRVRESTLEHDAILTAALTRDPHALADAVRHHCAMTRAAVVHAIEQRAASDARAA
jgi:DNA-binding GntR family transcriptional regulator